MENLKIKESEKIFWNLHGKILSDQYRPNEIKFFLKTVDNQCFVEILEYSQILNEDGFLELLFYYLWLFRDDRDINLIINQKGFPTKYLIKYIFSSMGRWISQGNDVDDFFNVVGLQFSSEKSLELLTKERVEQIDISLGLVLICNLKERDLNRFLFEIHETDYIVNLFIEVFDQLEEDRIKGFFIKNPPLFATLVNILKEFSIKKGLSKFEKFIKRFQAEVEVIENLISAARTIHCFYDVHSEKKKNLFERDMKRIIQIVMILDDTKFLQEKLELLFSESVILDSEEIHLIENIITNPYLKSILIKKEDLEDFENEPRE
ncbi:MAG TPA: hypothetical protein PK079_03315 [Leptospiraceae bacterium]|nr:hypothetical protein [Leptospiraceae bacterium]HMX34265.1 hypothetical protein [Leptospiraceae bacterium]HMY29763.1 hypothetical protein [Leptospiraceae bacterium]HMZ62838.1 hypothetical protein [Leptospiraceae bacterium]HNA06913.1 hypothetical protein [Leptospiraceae bacterium]